MTSVMWVTFFVGHAISCALAWFYASRLASRQAVRETVDELRQDLDATIAEWNRRVETGDVARSLELPGLHAVRRMLNSET